jgi:hypothetical protein
MVFKELKIGTNMPIKIFLLDLQTCERQPKKLQ